MQCSIPNLILGLPCGACAATRLLGYLPPVPLDTLVQLHPRPAEAVQRASDGEVNLPSAQLLDHVQVGEISPAASVGDGYAAPPRQARDKLLVDATLQALVVGGVYQELRAVGLELSYRLCMRNCVSEGDEEFFSRSVSFIHVFHGERRGDTSV